MLTNRRPLDRASSSGEGEGGNGVEATALLFRVAHMLPKEYVHINVLGPFLVQLSGRHKRIMSVFSAAFRAS